MEYSHNQGSRDLGYENIPMTRDAKLRLFVNIPLLTLPFHQNIHMARAFRNILHCAHFVGGKFKKIAKNWVLEGKISGALNLFTLRELRNFQF
jgi:hypothetical protein